MPPMTSKRDIGMVSQYVGPDLAEALVPRSAFRLVDRTCERIASRAQDVMHRSAAAATPSRTGVVRDSWLSMPIVRVAGGVRAVTSNPHWLASLLEHGVAPHEIEPERKRAETFPGAEHPVGSVHHPGFGGYHMAVKAVETTEAALPWAAQPALERFAREWEAEAQLMAGRLY